MLRGFSVDRVLQHYRGYTGPQFRAVACLFVANSGNSLTTVLTYKAKEEGVMEDKTLPLTLPQTSGEAATNRIALER